MLGPHDREDAQLDQVRRAAEAVFDNGVFLGRETVLGDDFGGDLGHGAPLAFACRERQWQG
jgi:hypothetical protein